MRETCWDLCPERLEKDVVKPALNCQRVDGSVPAPLHPPPEQCPEQRWLLLFSGSRGIGAAGAAGLAGFEPGFTVHGFLCFTA